MKIAIFYHCLFYSGNPPDLLPRAFDVSYEQMRALEKSGLLSAAHHFVVGINGGEESSDIANLVIPFRAQRHMHGLQSKSENLTIVEIEKWAKNNPGWAVLYFHAKGATHIAPWQIMHGNQWRNCMMRHTVWEWRKCVQDLEQGYDSVGCHWLTSMGSDNSQNYWGGNFFWAKSSFLASLPSIHERARIKESGISSLESRYEAEVWIGNGNRLPKVKDYHKVNPSIRGSCL